MRREGLQGCQVTGNRVRRRAPILLALLLLAGSLTAQSLPERIDRALPALIETYRALHASPELSTREEKTSATLAAALREIGFTVTERVGRYTDGAPCYGVVAVMKSGDGPVVLVRSDMDGLPVTEQTGAAYASKVRTANATGEEVGVMHACGHDVHMTSLIGTARMLAATKSAWRGTVVLIGQPAEEIVKGADAMLRDGLYERFPRPDYVLGLHDWASLDAGKIGYRSGYMLANSDSINLTVRGIGGHGAAPEKSKDPIVVAAEIILALQTIVSRENSPLDPAVVTVGAIHGGSKRNIIPDEVQLLITVRTYKPEVRRRVLTSIERVARGIAMAAGIPDDRSPIFEHVKHESADALYNDPPLTDRVSKALLRTMGKETVLAIEPAMVSEDFGRLSDGGKVPVMMFFVGASDPVQVAAGKAPGLHSSGFLPVIEPTLRSAILAMTTAVHELLPPKK